MFLASLSLLSYLLFFFFFVAKTAAPTPATPAVPIAMARGEETLCLASIHTIIRSQFATLLTLYMKVSFPTTYLLDYEEV